ncbi:MAG: flagellar basal body rod protein FlgC [Desulfobacterales bacterium]|nr:flagellar basal body rod protein FlgC [Desulfobacterales bacterium]
MDFFSALNTSSSGLTAQRLRMNLISQNLANINTTRTAEGGPYRRKDVVIGASPIQDNFLDVLSGEMVSKPSNVQVMGIVEDPRSPRLVYDPEHPDANPEGYVAMPNVNLMEEMVNMISATRSYEANVTATKATKDMALKALEIGQ